MEELSRHNIAISYATTHGQDCSVFVEEQDSEWYFSNSAAYDHPKSLSECNVSEFDGLLIPSSYGGLTDLVNSRFVAHITSLCHVPHTHIIKEFIRFCHYSL
jgi:hypothetical protein